MNSRSLEDEVAQQLGVAMMGRRPQASPLVLEPPFDELAHREVGRERVAPALHVVDQPGELGLRARTRCEQMHVCKLFAKLPLEGNLRSPRRPALPF
jgi:hypothetical protein